MIASRCHPSTHPSYASLRSSPRGAAPVNAARCWYGQPGAARATLCCFINARLGRDPQVGALQGFACQFTACAVPYCLLPGLRSTCGYTLCVQVPLLLREHISTSLMMLQTYRTGWLDSLVIVCRSLCCHPRLLVSGCALQVACESGKGRHRGRFCLLLCDCLSLVKLVPRMSFNHSGEFWRAQTLPRHQQYGCMSLRPDRTWLFDPTTRSIVLAEGADASGPNSVFQRFLFFGESSAMGQSRRSQATKLRSANRPGKRERACIQTTIKLTASAKGAARKPLDRRFDAPTFPPPPPPPPRRDRVGHVAPQADMLASRDGNLAHRTPSTSSGTEPHPISPEAQLDALRGRLHRKLIESCRGMTDFMPTFVTTKPLPCTGSGPNITLGSCNSEALLSRDIAHHPCAETKSPGGLSNRSITGVYMVAVCCFLCLASGLCLCFGFPSHTVHQVRGAPAEKNRALTLCCFLGKTPPIDDECWLDMHCACQCFCNSLAGDPSGSMLLWGRGLGWAWISLEALQGWLLSPTFYLMELYQLLLAQPKVRTHVPARGHRSKFRSYASLCLLATYLAGCCHMGLALGMQSHPYLEACRSIHIRMPGLDRTRPMHQRLRSAWRALSAPTLAVQRLVLTMNFGRSCRYHWGAALAVAMMLLTWLEVQPRPYHAGTVDQVTNLALVEVLFDGSIWVPLSAISGVLLAALCFRQFCAMPGPKSGGGRGYSFRCLKWLLLLLVVSSQTASVSGVKVDASVAQQASRVSSDTKHGSSFVNAPSTAVWSKTRKRSFKRACTRAARNPDQRALYRGRWIKAGDGLKGRAAQAADVTQSSSAVRLRIFNWNSGGLTTLRFEELKQWLYAQLEHARPHLVILQETMWKSSMEWTDEHYTCIHTGSGKPKEGGILIMISKSLCSPDKIRYDEIQLGRILHVKIPTEPSIELLAVYQHAWRSDVSSAARESLLAKRLSIWRRIQQFAESTAIRSQLLIAGDFNTQIETKLPFAGPGTRGNVRQHQRAHWSDPKNAAPDADVFHHLLQCCDLQALNTFSQSGTHSSTFRNTTTKASTQIDFVLARRTQSDNQSRCARPYKTFPLLPVEGMYHIPLTASVPRIKAPRTRPTAARLRPDVATLMLQRSPQQGQAFKELVQYRLQAVRDADHINHILLSSWQIVFGSQPRAVHKHKGLCLSAMWHHRKLASTAHTVFARWRHAVKYRSIRKQLHAQAVVAKRARLQQQLQDAESASHSRNPGMLYQVLRSIAPKIRRRRMQLRDADHKLAGPDKEPTLVMQHFADVFAAKQATTGFTLREAFPFTAEEFTQCLHELPAHKALPAHCAPAPLWKWCCEAVGAATTKCLGGCFQPGSFAEQWPEDWSVSYLCLLPKTDQQLDEVNKMRPISLLNPLGKSFAGMLMCRIRADVTKAVAPFPQFAYLTGRSTMDAIDRAMLHMWQTQNRTGRQYTLHHRRAGVKQQALLGSVTLSVDLSKAFDSIARDHIRSSLEWAGIPGAVVDVILGMHHAMTLQYSTSSHSARTATGKGVRQGCRLAPILWSCFTGWLMSKLVPVLSNSDLHYLLTLFADDTLCQWEVNDVEQVHRVIKQIGFLLDFLQQHGLRANLDKTVVLAKFVGYRHTKEWKKCTEHHPDKNLCLKVATHSGKVLLPVKTSHKYLGVQLSYHHMARDTVNYRIKCAQASFARLNVALKRTSKLSLRGKIRLWNAVVHSTLRYGITCTGFDVQGMQKYRALFMRHLRAICDSPVHLTRESNEALLVRAGVDCPLYTLASQTVERHRITAAQEVFKVQPPALTELWNQVLASIRPSDKGQDTSPTQLQREIPHAALTQESHSASTPLPVTASLPDEATAPVTSRTTLENPQVPQLAEPASIEAMGPDRNVPPAAVVPAPEHMAITAGTTKTQDSTPIAHHSPTNVPHEVPASPIAASPAAFAHADFQCPVCAYRAENTSALRYHMSVKHGLSERQIALESRENFRFEDHAFAGMPTCKHCMRSFTGVPQLRNHIVAQVCPKLHGVTQSAKAPVPQPAIPSASDVSCVPLRDRPETLHSLKQGGWRELARSSGFRQTALEHCPLCHLWVANASGQVKKHITQKHKDLANLVKQVIADCRADKTDITSPCQLCNREWKGPKIRHRESCTVLFAARLLEALLVGPSQISHDDQDTVDGVRGGVHGCLSGSQQEEQPGSSRGEASTAAEGQRSGETRRSRSSDEGSPQRLSASGGEGFNRGSGVRELRIKPGIHDPGLATSVGTMANELPELPGPGTPTASRSDVQAPSSPRARDHAPARRFRLRPSPRCRDARNHSDIGCSERGICEQENERTQDEPNLEADNAVDRVQNIEGSPCQVGGDTRLVSPREEVRMASPHGQSVASSQVEPGERAAHSRGATKDVSTCSVERSPGQHSGDSRGGQGVASVQCHTTLQRSDGHHSHVFHPSVTPGAESSAVVPASPGPMRSGMPSNDRRNIAQGKVGAPAVGKADSQPERSSQSLLTSSGPHLRNLTPLQWHAKVKAWKLRNQGCNSCYANALTLCLLWLEGYTNTGILQGPMGNSLRSLMQAGTPTDLWSIMSWVSATRGWTQPRQQHDVIEFLTFLSRTLNPGVIHGKWGAAGSALHRDRLEVVDSGSTWPLLLATRPASSADDPTPCRECTLQDLVTCWHEQAEPRALTEPPAFCVVQVGRFDVKPDGTYSKTDFKLDLDSFVYLPVFRDNLRDVYFLKYQLRACVVHHGSTPSNGHYRAVLMSSTGAIQDAFYTDDNTNARKVKPAEHSVIAQNVYAVFLQRTD